MAFFLSHFFQAIVLTLSIWKHRHSPLRTRVFLFSPNMITVTPLHSSCYVLILLLAKVSFQNLVDSEVHARSSLHLRNCKWSEKFKRELLYQGCAGILLPDWSTNQLPRKICVEKLKFGGNYPLRSLNCNICTSPLSGPFDTLPFIIRHLKQTELYLHFITSIQIRKIY